jgi:hypothetical protein
MDDSKNNKTLPDFKNSNIMYAHYGSITPRLSRNGIDNLMNNYLGDNTSHKEVFEAMWLAIELVDKEMKDRRAIIRLEFVLSGIEEGVSPEGMVEIISDNLRRDINRQSPELSLFSKVWEKLINLFYF